VAPGPSALEHINTRERRTCTKEAFRSLESHLLEIVDPFFCASAYHGVFSRYLITCHWVIRGDSNTVGNDVEVWQRWLDHDDISAFIYVAALHVRSSTEWGWNDLQQLFGLDLGHEVEAGSIFGYRMKVHFRLPLYKVSSSSSEQITDSPERSIKATSEFRRVAHQSTSVGQSRTHQTSLDSLDPSIHHITRCDTMCSSFSISYSNFGNPRCRLLSIECWLVGMTGVGEGRQDTTVPVGCVFTKTDIDGEHELRE